MTELKKDLFLKLTPEEQKLAIEAFRTPIIARGYSVNSSSDAESSFSQSFDEENSSSQSFNENESF
jgi:hypothetical protein